MVRNADMLGPPITLTLNGSETVKTFFGSVLTLVLFGATLASTVYFLIKFGDKSAPTVLEKIVRHPDFQPIDFGKEKFIPIFFVRDYYDLPVPAERSIKVISPQLEVNFLFKKDGKFGAPEFKNFSHGTCREIHENAQYLDYFSDAENWAEVKDHILKNGVCIKIDKKDQHLIRSVNPNYFYQNKVDRVVHEYSDLTFTVDPCDVAESGECFGDKVLGPGNGGDNPGNGYIEYRFPKSEIFLDDSKEPIKKHWELEEGPEITEFVFAVTNYYSHYLSVVEDESQYLGKATKVDSFISLDLSTSEKVERNKTHLGGTVFQCNSKDPAIPCTSFFSIKFKPEKKEIYINRSYTKALDLLSEIGGIYSLLTSVLSFVNILVLNLIKSNYYIASLFPVLPLKSFTCKKKKKYREVSKQVESDIDKHNKYWSDLGDEAVQMVESSIDLAVLFREICTIRVIANLLLDDKQKEMVTLASFYQFKTTKESKKESEKKKKSDSKSVQMTKDRKARAKIFYEIQQRLMKGPDPQSAEGAPGDCAPLEPKLARRIDEEIVKAYKELKLETFQVHEDPSFHCFKQLERDHQVDVLVDREDQAVIAEQNVGHRQTSFDGAEIPEKTQLIKSEDKRLLSEAERGDQNVLGPKQQPESVSIKFADEMDEGVGIKKVKKSYNVDDQ